MTSYHWTPTIGDPTAAGWITVVAYFAASILCVATARGVGDHERRWWIGLAVLLVLLGINKQLDLQTLLIDIARDGARAQGWYDDRKPYQRLFIGAMIVAGAVTAAVLMIRLGAWAGAAARFSALGMSLLGAFVVIRAASFNHVDLMLGQRFAGVRFNTAMELGPIIMIGAAAWKARRDRPALP